MREIKTITKYECDICGDKFDSTEECVTHEIQCKKLNMLRRSVRDRVIMDKIDTGLVRYYFHAQSEEEAKIFIKQTGSYRKYSSEIKDLQYPLTLIIEQYYSHGDYEHDFYTAESFMNKLNENIWEASKAV